VRTLPALAFVGLVVATAVAGVVLALTAPVRPLASAGGVVPVIVADDAVGADCTVLGHPFGSEVLTVADGRIDGAPPAGVALAVDPGGRTVAWAASFPLHAVLVAAGERTHVYAYEPPGDRDAGLAAPHDPGGLPARIERVLLCWRVDGVGLSWCPPEFWADPASSAAWTATGIAPDDRFADVLGFAPARSEAARGLGAPSAPSLRQVVAAPGWYGRDVAELVADVLSDAHPDVPFAGTRPSGTCPL
jgi:hypothetical protein